MNRQRLLERKAIIENQIKMFEARIVREKDPVREKLLFERVNLIGQSLERMNKLLGM